jgi:hypothetical protein
MPQSSATFVGSSCKGPLSADLISKGVAYTHGIGAPVPLSTDHDTIRRDLAATDLHLDIIRRELGRRKKTQARRDRKLSSYLKSDDIETEEICHTLPAESGAPMLSSVFDTEGCELHLMTEPDPRVYCCSASSEKSWRCQLM